jgi:pimeloyl-ACP methyl ester carboxylesterase
MPPKMPHVDGVDHAFVDAGGLRMHVATAGQEGADPILCLHGWPQHWYEWRKLIGPLTDAGYRVVCPDLRGLGWTDAPPRGYEKEQLATDVLALMDAMDLDRVKLVGHDWGGWAGYLMCLREPERFERFVALNIFPPFVERSWAAIRTTWRLWYQVALAAPVLGKRNAARMGRLSESFYDRAGMGLDVWSREERSIFLDYLAEPDRVNATVQYYRTFQLRELWGLARGRYARKRLRTPTLLLHGTDDMVQDPVALRGVERHADDFTVELVEGCGHFIADQRPDLVAERTMEFFRGD